VSCPSATSVPTIAAVNERPTGVADAEVAAVLREHWGQAATLLEYLPVGYGGYHWGATVADGRRFFVTLSHVTDDDGFADLAGQEPERLPRGFGPIGRLPSRLSLMASLAIGVTS
jgi:hypothetical protein